MAKVRNYNSILAFTSMGSKISSPPLGRGLYCFRIHVKVYYNATPIGPNTRNPKYTNLYFMDAALKDMRVQIKFRKQRRVLKELDERTGRDASRKKSLCCHIRDDASSARRRYRRAELKNLQHKTVGMIISSRSRNFEQQPYV